ncbi:MAG: lipid A export permease/ATP-binding protein MsbA [Rhodocyclaceae bacterium]
MSDADAAPTASSLKVYFRLLGYIKPYMAFFGLSVLGYAIAASAKAMLAGVFKYFIDGLAAEDDAMRTGLAWLDGMELMYAVPVLVVLISLWQGAGTFLGNYSISKVSLGLVHDLRSQLFNSFLVLPNRFYDQHNSGHLVSKVTYNVTMVTSAATDAIKIVFREGLTVVVLFAYLLWMNWQLTLGLIVVLPVMAWLVTSASRKFRKLSRNIQVSMGELTHVASETIQNYRVVRSFGGEDYEQARFLAASQDNARRQLRLVRTEESFSALLNIIIYTAMGLLLFMVLKVRGEATAGDIVAYITAAGLLPRAIRQLGDVSSKIQRGVAAADSIFEQLDEAPERNNGSVARERVSGRLTVRDLSFRYPENEAAVLEDISFELEPGRMLALVGRSGSGKSTLASLIPRFYDYQQGQILLDGVDVADYELRNLRRHIALVTQQVNLFNGTVAQNIAYGELAGVDRARIEAAAEAANAREFIDQLPQGFDTEIGENGVMLSGGQRQRLAIARALLKNAPILILDEATSALDTESERLIQSAIERLAEGRTTIVIAHRLSTIERADQILVMDGGRIVERGRHAELLARGGAYARLQASGLEEAAP